MQQLLAEQRPSRAGAEISEITEDSWEQKLLQGKPPKSKPRSCEEQDFQKELLASEIKVPIKFVGETGDRSAEYAGTEAKGIQHNNHYRRRACTCITQ